MTVRLDKKKLKRDIFVGGERVVKSLITPLIEQKIQDEQRQLIKDFEDHPVTQEILAGNTAENSTGLLGGHGNLFSFIGFDEGSNPIDPLSSIFRRRISYSIKRTNDYGGFNVSINIPEKAELERVAKVDWLKGRSWIDGIERGLAGLNRYLYDEDYGFDNSLSGTAVQTKHVLRMGVTYKKTSYVSKILSDFKNRLTRLI